MTLWPHQQRGLDDVRAAIAAGCRRLCITSPTGGGKTRMIATLVDSYQQEWRRVLILTHRKLLTGQTSNVFDAMGINHGIMASGHSPALLRDVQVASIWTLNERCLKSERWELPDADLVIVDEAHAMTNETARQLMAEYTGRGATILGFTATPVKLAGLYDRLIVAGRNSELRECGAHVPCDTYAPDEPDMHGVKRTPVGEYREGDVVKRIMVATVFGRVFDHWKRLNPNGRATILFAPGVKESRWFVEQFERRGVRAAHIDAETPDNEREDIIAASRAGDIRVVCNRFVMREGVDMPWLGHCIMATVFGAVSNYLQAGGRLLRSYPGLLRVTLQDHGGNWWRHGSLNADREWELGDTDVTIARKQQRERQAGEAEHEPICCPNCQAIRRAGSKCPFCGHEHKRSVRMVLQKNGELKRMQGDAVKRKREKPPEERRASQAFYRAANSRMTVGQLAGLYFRQHGEPFPDGVVRVTGGKLVTLPGPNSLDYSRRVAELWPEARRRVKA